jgi:hypothetical protein
LMAGGGMGSGTSTSTSTHIDSSGRLVTETSRTTISNGESRTTITKQVRHSDGRVEQTEQYKLNGQPVAALPSGSSSANGNARNIEITSGPLHGGASRRPIDLRSPTMDIDDEEEDDEVQEIPAPPRRSPPASRHAHSQSYAPSVGAAPPRASPPAATASPSYPPASSTQHHRAATLTFGTPQSSGPTQEYSAAHRAQARKLEAERDAKRAMDASRNAASSQRSPVDPTAHARSSSSGASTATGASSTYVPPSSHTRAASSFTGGAYQPSTSARFNFTDTGAAPSSRFGSTATRLPFDSTLSPPPPITSTARGVSEELLQQRRDRGFEEMYREHQREFNPGRAQKL